MTRFTTTPLLALLALALTPACKPQNPSAQPEIIGTWRGNSECTFKNSPCRDETNIYRFTAIAARPGWFSGDGSKLVKDKEVSMGPLVFRYDASTHILQSNTPNGVFRFVIHDDKMVGTLSLPDSTIYRRIHLTKVK
ncbi:hypothetical protein [Occallatibacter riparius]|uniref:Uncharacterized protein n=1 Tax=Occallatibacter riparius TaxID=1002689 RepID=A0A9J7BLR6_9BACT|nr:hypothetical protein [Occallatibacter riparius]UWZ83828.1 hypothetical protein MOP44_25110 [Occallatibacter riparius]